MVNVQHLRIIQIGVGGFGEQWVAALPLVDEVEVVGLVDIRPEAMASAGRKLGLPPGRQFVSLDQAMDTVEFDAAVIVIPPSARLPVYRRLAQAGKHIVCEKPLADSWENALLAREIAHETGVRFVISQNYRYGRNMQALRKAVSSGKYGSPVVSHIEFCAYPRFFGFREEMPYPLLIDMSIHHFDLMRFALGANPVSVTGRSWNSPWSVYRGDASASLIFEFEEGKFATYNASWASLRALGKWSFKWDIECEGGLLSLEENLVRGTPYRLNEEGKPTWGEWEEVPLDPERNGQAEILRQFVRSIRGGPPAATDVDDNIFSLAMVFHSIQACEQGVTVPIVVPPGS